MVVGEELQPARKRHVWTCAKFSPAKHRRTLGFGLAQTTTSTTTMKKFLSLLTIIALSSAPAFAGCGKSVTNEGKLKSFDAATKTLEVEGKDGKVAKITLTPTTKGADSVSGLVGKAVKVESEHNKATSVAAGS